MKQLFLFLSFSCLSALVSYAQPNSLLQKALRKYSQIQNFSCECLFATDGLMNISFSCKMEATRNALDTICGFYYYIKYVPGEGTSDFSLYNGSDYYMSYKGKITQTNRLKKPDAFKDKEMNIRGVGKGRIPSVAKSPTMCRFSLFEFENQIRKDLKDSTFEFVAGNDTLIDKVICFQFRFRKNNMVKEISIEKESLFPKYYKSTGKSALFNQTQTALFNNFEANGNLPLSYYAAENLLPLNWEANNPVKTTIELTGKEAPGWTLPLLNNDAELTLKELKGKVVLLEFTATWCVHCIEAAEMMKSLNEKFKDNANIVLLSVFSSSPDDKNKIQKFAEKHKISNEILYNAKSVGDMYQVDGYPVFFIIDSTGKIVKQYPGYGESTENRIFEDLNKLGKPFSDKMKFVDNYENINSLKDCVKSFKGKKVYIDVWATWCAPCIEEFENKERLLELLNPKGVPILYISIDEEKNDIQWKNMIKFYDLKGYHIRANNKLSEDLRKIYNQNGLLAIPWYILIDEQGNIKRKYAKKPSQIGELKKEIDEI